MALRFGNLVWWYLIVTVPQLLYAFLLGERYGTAGHCTSGVGHCASRSGGTLLQILWRVASQPLHRPVHGVESQSAAAAGSLPRLLPALRRGVRGV
jgi:hypothetical protein